MGELRDEREKREMKHKKIMVVGNADDSKLSDVIRRMHAVAKSLDPNESPSSPRNRGSLTAPFGQNEAKGTASQLAHSLPASRNEQCAGGVDDPCEQCPGMSSEIDCDDCIHGL
jgi:hypothetical protein